MNVSVMFGRKPILAQVDHNTNRYDSLRKVTCLSNYLRTAIFSSNPPHRCRPQCPARPHYHVRGQCFRTFWMMWHASLNHQSATAPPSDEMEHKDHKLSQELTSTILAYSARSYGTRDNDMTYIGTHAAKYELDKRCNTAGSNTSCERISDVRMQANSSARSSKAEAT